jgi:hypothetical protein
VYPKKRWAMVRYVIVNILNIVHSTLIVTLVKSWFLDSQEIHKSHKCHKSRKINKMHKSRKCHKCHKSHINKSENPSSPYTSLLH